MSRRLVLTALLVPLLGVSSLGQPADVLTFAVDGQEGVSFDGEYPINQHLLDAPRPMSVKVSNGAEPSILVDKDGQWLWIGDTSGLWRSGDGGATWTRAPDPFLPSVVTDGWALAQDAEGRLYTSTTIGPTSPVAMSLNNGQTWTTTSHVVGVDSISDRPWLAARGNGEVTLIVNGDRGEECYRSTDAALTFTSISTINNGRANAGNVVYDSAGAIWFHNQQQLWVWKNPCATPPLPIDTVDGGPALFTQVDIDSSDRIYWAQPSADSSQIILSARLKTGVLPPRTFVVNDPALRSNTFPTLSVLDNGDVAVAWYGSETPGNPSVTGFPGSWNVFVARISGFWGPSPTVSTVRITTEPNHVGDFCMGGVGCGVTATGDRDLLDYFMIDADDAGTIHIAYGHDGATDDSEVRYAKVTP